jgi:hypothetical protein
MAVLTLSEKLDQLGARYDEMTQQLSSPEVVSDSVRFQKLAKQHAELEEIVEKHRQFKQNGHRNKQCQISYWATIRRYDGRDDVECSVYVTTTRGHITRFENSKFNEENKKYWHRKGETGS